MEVADKVRLMAEKIQRRLRLEKGLPTVSFLERTLRAELQLLLEAAHKAVEYHENFEDHPQCAGCGLAAELRNWRKE